jgi:hypothetical protein
MVLGKVGLHCFVRTVRVADEDRQLSTNHLAGWF